MSYNKQVTDFVSKMSKPGCLYVSATLIRNAVVCMHVFSMDLTVNSDYLFLNSIITS
jgi:hypothetical protein